MITKVSPRASILESPGIRNSESPGRPHHSRPGRCRIAVKDSYLRSAETRITEICSCRSLLIVVFQSEVSNGGVLESRRNVVRCLRVSSIILIITAFATASQESSLGQRRTTSAQPQQEISKAPLTDRWYGITSPDGDYTAEFPSKPNYHKTGPDQRGQVYHDYQFYDPKCRCNFEIMSYKLNLSLEQQARFDEVEQSKGSEQLAPQSSLKQGWRLLSMKELPGNGHQHLFMVPGDGVSQPTIYVRDMLFNRGFYVYSIIFTGATREALFGPEALRFFNSFKFTRRK